VEPLNPLKETLFSPATLFFFEFATKNEVVSFSPGSFLASLFSMIAYMMNERLHFSKDNHFTHTNAICADIQIDKFDGDERMC
jgi:hypothetical protein